jgi:hypothetical protein
MDLAFILAHYHACFCHIEKYNINKTANSQDYFVSIYLSHYNTSPFKEKLTEMHFHFHTSPSKSSTVAARYINPQIANFLA